MSSINYKDYSDEKIMQILVFPSDYQNIAVENAIKQFKSRKILKRKAKKITENYCRKRIKQIIGSGISANDNLILPNSYIFTERELNNFTLQELGTKISKIDIFKVGGDNYI